MNQFRRSLFIFVTLVAVLSLFLAACGDDDDDDDDTGNGNGAVPTATTGGEDGGDATEPTDGEDGGDATEATGEDGDTGGDGDAAAAGEAIYEAQCASCHSIDGSEGIGPTWEGIWEREETLADGSTVTVDEEYVTESIREPNAKVVEGYSEGIMPAFDLSDEEIDQLIAFMQTL